MLPLAAVTEDAGTIEQGIERIADKVVIVQADTLDLPTYLELLKEKEIDCMILSPGPGRADREEVSTGQRQEKYSSADFFAQDVPNLMQIIDKTEIPILGVCLGMQAIAVYNGAKVCIETLVFQGIFLTCVPSRSSIRQTSSTDMSYRSSIIAHRSSTVSPLMAFLRRLKQKKTRGPKQWMLSLITV